MTATVATIAQAASRETSAIETVGAVVAWIVLSVIGLGLYMLPTIIAIHRDHHNTTAILMVNLFGGLVCGLGWFFALFWSFTSPPPSAAQTVIVSGTPTPIAVTSSYPPGWYPDPYTAGHERWWDGHAWTAHQQVPLRAPTPPTASGPVVDA